MDNDVTLTNASSQTRQKRVLPSRSRRGGPGVGNCDVDVMILNTQLNKLESEPLIPAETLFVMKTNDTLERVAKEFSSAGGSGLNLRAHESYFERPEVLKAYREQTIIETPEYSNVSEVPSVGSRFRPRLVEENNLDSDAVYEKRHRKYESFEKRQRLREKEKLKHEQYKLKERIEQLRAMDNSAFLAAPASSFSPRPGMAEVVEEDSNVPGGLNGNPAYHEGERRRKEMLMTAQSLEERYRVLLPPDRQRKPAGQSSVNVSTEPESELSAKEFLRPHDDDSELDEDFTPHVHQKQTQKLKLKLPARPIMPPTTIASKAASASKKRHRSSISFVAPPKSPAAPRRSRIGLDVTPSAMGHPTASTSELGPSSTAGQLLPISEPVPDTSMSYADTVVVPSLRIMQYNPEADNHNLSRPRGKRPKRAKTEERGPPSPSREHPAPLPESYIVVDDEPMSPKRSPSPVHDTSLSFSFPPPPPPADHFSPSPETSVPPRDTSLTPAGTISPLGSTPEPQFYPSLQLPSPPPADETPAFPNSSVPPAEPIVVDRKPSVPPIESISAPVTRRGRSRAVVTKPARKTPKRRNMPPCYLVSFADRTAKNPRQIKQSRHLEAFGVKLPPIIGNTSDSYDFELPPEVFAGPDFDDRTQDPDAAREVEGSQGPEDTDDLERGQDLDGTLPDDSQYLGADDPEDEDTDQDLDGT
ncbi:hypothetical protein C8R44DRAFT_266658 [Mycena epipterygia]|nr:hypothetical protein C8R44DRAFT_266658 [Mycena epipterygia]